MSEVFSCLKLVARVSSCRKFLNPAMLSIILFEQTVPVTVQILIGKHIPCHMLTLAGLQL